MATALAWPAAAAPSTAMMPALPIAPKSTHSQKPSNHTLLDDESRSRELPSRYDRCASTTPGRGFAQGVWTRCARRTDFQSAPALHDGSVAAWLHCLGLVIAGVRRRDLHL